MIVANSCKECKHDKGKCVGASRAGSHRYCFEQKEMTNADRIRAMSDEELAKHFSGMICDINEGVEYHENPNRWLEWLKQPVDEVKG